ncbi:MAG: LacI family DNA-binding transcriptional regulator [Treponemataceae bacterium]|nr:LacI family DNA-binding transcriptional regulator [Treponemataceae bacterium]
MKVTIKDLAEKAGVSKTTVSFAFNNPSRISKETCEKIMTIAKEIGYSPDPVARYLATKQTGTIGILFPQAVAEVLENPYCADLVRGIGAVCDQHDLSIILLSPLKGVLNNTIKNAAVDGMIIFGIDNDSSIHTSFTMRNMPYISIDAKSKPGCVNVGIDEKKMAEKLMDVLLDNGHTRIMFCSLKPIFHDVSEYNMSITNQERRKGIEQSILKHNLTLSVMENYSYVEIETSFEDSYKKAKEILQSPDRPSAIYCMGDIQAFGFYKSAAELGINIPEDLSVVTFDDLKLTHILYPEITAIHQPGYEKGVAAAELLMKKISGEECDSIEIESCLIKRKSVAPAKF